MLVVASAMIAAACSSAGETPSAPTPTPTAEVTVRPAGAPCPPGELGARVTAWEGAAGSRIATVELTNDGATACTLPAASWPALVDASGAILIEGTPPAGTADVQLAPGKALTASVRVSNYCGADPVTPLTIAISLPAGQRVVAEPLSPTDTTMPPCMGDPGSPGRIEVQSWQPST